MPSRSLEDEIDRLYQLPLDQFTAARNALAKGAGAEAGTIKALVKPPVAAWAVNQLHWRKRDVWDALIAAADNARRTHKAVLSGRSGDVRAAGAVHDEAVEDALKATLALAADAGHPPTDATKHAIATTLRALPGDERPGRLTRTLQPGGFEALAGLAIGAVAGRKTVVTRPKESPPARAPATRAEPAEKPKVDSKALARARTAVASTSRELREAEQAARREEFEIARTTREEQRAETAVEHARDELARAKASMDRAQAEATAARRNREAAEKRSRDANQTVTAARSRAEAAEAELKRIEKG